MDVPTTGNPILDFAVISLIGFFLFIKTNELIDLAAKKIGLLKVG